MERKHTKKTGTAEQAVHNIRRGSSRDVASAISDGARAAKAAMRLLEAD